MDEDRDRYMTQQREDEARHYAEMEAEAERQQRLAHDAEQALEFAVGVWGVPVVLGWLADFLSRPTPDDDTEPF